MNAYDLIIKESKHKCIKLYHYSAKPHSELLTNSLRNVVSDHNVVSEDYDDHLSFFMEPIPVDIAKQLNNEFDKWKSGTVLFEHVIYLSNIKITKWEFASTPEGRAFYIENFDISKRKSPGYIDEYLDKKAKFKKDNNLIGISSRVLANKIPSYISDDKMGTYIKINKKHGRVDQYASEIPHLLINTKSPVKVTKVNRLKLK